MNEREQGESSVEQFLKAIEARLDVDDDDAHVLTRDGFELLKAAWNTRASPPATTAGEPKQHTAECLAKDVPWCECPPSVPVHPVDEIVREIDALAEKALPLPYHGAINGGEDIDEELTTIESGHVEVAADVPNDTAEFLIRLANAWPQLRAALSSRTAGEKAVTVEEIQHAFFNANGQPDSCQSTYCGRPYDVESGLHAVHALVAQRGVR